MSKRHTNSPEFKARVAIEAISGPMTIQEIAANSAERMIQVSQWMVKLLNRRQRVSTHEKKSHAIEATVQRSRGENGTDGYH
jgi:putative transposase